MKLFVLIIIFMVITGCATTPIPTNEAIEISGDDILDTRYISKKEGYGQVIIKRDSGAVGSACRAIIHVNAVETAKLWSSEKVLLYLPVGNHMFGLSFGGFCLGDGSITELRAHITEENPTVLRVGIAGAPVFSFTAY